MRNHELMVQHVEALFSHDDAGRLVRVNEPNGGPAPRFFVGNTDQGPVCRYRFDVSDLLRRDLEAIALGLPSNDGEWRQRIDVAPFRARLEREVKIERVWTGPAFAFPTRLAPGTDTQQITIANAELLHRHLSEWVADATAGRPMHATIVDDAAVSVCCSVRETAMAHEAGVETAPAFRGRGYAAASVAAWARDVRASGITPLYSTSWENKASLAVARKLDLVQFGSDLHLT